MSLPENITEYSPGIERMGDVGDGWKLIVGTLHDFLVRLDPEYTIDQIKEKFGGLRYYYTPSVPYESAAAKNMYALVRFAEALASRTCENCGLPGSLRDSTGWYVTLCDGCEGKRQAERDGRNSAQPS